MSLTFGGIDYNAMSILTAPGLLMLGLPMSPEQWSFVSTIQAAGNRGVFDLETWLSGCFAHGDLFSRDVDALANVPDATKPISIDFDVAQPHAIMKERGAPVAADLSFMSSLGPQFLSNYRKGCFDISIRGILPRTSVWTIAGEADIPISIGAFWSIESDDKANGDGFVKCKLVHNADHCVSILQSHCGYSSI